VHDVGELHFQLAAQELTFELGVLSDVGGDHFPDLVRLEEQAQAPVVDAAVVGDDRQVADPAANQRGNQILGNAAQAESADDECRPVPDVSDRLIRRGDHLVDHRAMIIQ